MRVVRTGNLSRLRSKSIAIIGYGSQGRAQALNLRDNGFAPLIGLPSRSASRRQAKSDGFEVTTVPLAIRRVDVIFVLAPDHLHGTIFQSDIESNLQNGQTLVFAHASSVHFGAVSPPTNVDVVLIAPLGPGKRLRELCGQRDGVACFVAVHQDASGNAEPVMLALAKAIGCLPAGSISTTFAHEAVGDLFGEQAVLCGGLGALLEAGVMTLIRHGLPPHTAYLECVYQLDLIIDLIKSEGLAGMYDNISPTAAYGSKVAGHQIITSETRKAMDALYDDIASGRFFKKWIREGTSTQSPQVGPSVAKQFQRGEREVLNHLDESS